MRLFEDITYGDSYGRSFLVLPDGSYYTCIEGQGTVWGEAYVIADAQIRLICADGEHRSYGPD
jgi:dipeptidase E